MLEKINNPKDLKPLSLLDLKLLCQELRNFIIDVISENGGHLASNLGVVELAVALHYVFEAPKDKIIWDVGHQSYVHKILTGRRDSFSSIRKKGGLSGFPNINESKYDAFGVGHSSTSISAGLGLAVARDVDGQKNEVISVIGDGALTGGLAFEGLNQLGYLQKNMIVILNDNKMSISLNVGALSEQGHRIEQTRLYKDIEASLNSLQATYNIKELIDLQKKINYFTTPGIVFEKMGINYIGPVDGYDLPKLISELKKAKAMNGPKLIHVKTIKGKGYKIAEDNASKFHGVKPFDRKNGQRKSNNQLKTFTDIFSDQIIELAKNNKDICAITAAMGGNVGLSEFSKVYPDRFFDVGIAEQHAVTFAAGLSKYGKKPVVAIYSTFLQRAYDQIIHDVCLQDLPVIFMVDRAGLVGEDGATHHGSFDLSYLRVVPNLIISSPADARDLKLLLRLAIKTQHPFAIRYSKEVAQDNLSDKIESEIMVGQGETLKNGSDVVIVGVGSMVPICIQSARDLMELGILAEVINARFIKPIDDKIFARIKEVGKAIIVEENSAIGGLYSAMAEQLVNDEVIIKNMSLPDRFISHGKIDELRQEHNLSAESVVEAVKQIL